MPVEIDRNHGAETPYALDPSQMGKIKILRYDHVIGYVPKNVLVAFDTCARLLVNEGRNLWYRRVSRKCDVKAGQAILKWMLSQQHALQSSANSTDNSDTSDAIQPLHPTAMSSGGSSSGGGSSSSSSSSSSSNKNNSISGDHVDDEADFHSCLRLHAAMHYFRLDLNHAGTVVRERIEAYMAMAPLTADEFAMLVETTRYIDPQLVETAISTLRHFRSVGRTRGFHGVPDWARICVYCDRMGIAVESEDMKGTPLKQTRYGWNACNGPKGSEEVEEEMYADDDTVEESPSMRPSKL